MPHTPQVQFVKAMEKINGGKDFVKFGKYDLAKKEKDGDEVLELHHYDTRILSLNLKRQTAEVSIFSRSDADAINSVLRIHGYASAAGFGPSKGPSVRDVGDLKVELVRVHLANPYGLL